jgi:hypothetical protein
MKRLLLIFFFACSFHTANAQRSLDELRNFVEEADSLSFKFQKIFYLYKIGPQNNSRKETWYYTLKNGYPVMFEVRYFYDSTEITEVYYVQNGRLICTEEYETRYNTTHEDQIAYGNINYYDNSMVREAVTMGQSRYNSKYENRRYNTIERFRKRFAELKENIQ